MYLTAVIDVYSRYIVGWGLSNTPHAEGSRGRVWKAEIVNSDQVVRLLVSSM